MALTVTIKEVRASYYSPLTLLVWCVSLSTHWLVVLAKCFCTIRRFRQTQHDMTQHDTTQPLLTSMELAKTRPNYTWSQCWQSVVTW